MLIKNMVLIDSKINDIHLNIANIEQNNKTKFEKLKYLIDQFNGYDNQFKSIKSNICNTEEDKISNENCNTKLRSERLNKVINYNKDIEQLLKNVINSSEDINGMVRIFVRVKGGTPSGDIINYEVKI